MKLGVTFAANWQQVSERIVASLATWDYVMNFQTVPRVCQRTSAYRGSACAPWLALCARRPHAYVGEPCVSWRHACQSYGSRWSWVPFALIAHGHLVKVPFCRIGWFPSTTKYAPTVFLSAGAAFCTVKFVPDHLHAAVSCLAFSKRIHPCSLM